MKVRWLVWALAAATVVITGFHHWDVTHKVLLVFVVVLGVLNLVAPMLERRMVRKIKAMPPEEREKFIARFHPRTQERLRKQLDIS